MIRVLLLEDDAVLSKEVSNYLVSRELFCDIVYDGDLFLKQMKVKPYDVYLLDINVPKINGLDVCKLVRTQDKKTPILMLTAFGEIDDKVQAFHLGADDYLIKPFHLEELFVRIQSLVRRKDIPQLEEVLRVADLEIDFHNIQVSRAGEVIQLTPKEFKLITLLARAGGKVLSKQQIANKLWDHHIETSQNTIEVYINFLRNKIDKNHTVKLIHTKVGFGYYLKPDEHKE